MRKASARLTYSNVVASLALFIALGGGAYAAATLPKNSVGPAQIKKNAVSSTKVKDGSLLKKDFKAGQLPAGATGATGPKGDKGDPGTNGTNGTNGSNGARGPSDGYVSENGVSGPLNSGGPEDSIALPAGNYIVTAGADMENGTTGGPGTVTCTLTPAGGLAVDQTSIELPGDPGTAASPDSAVFNLAGPVTLAGPGSVEVNCAAGGTAVNLDNLKMTAIRVETLTVEPAV